MSPTNSPLPDLRPPDPGAAGSVFCRLPSPFQAWFFLLLLFLATVLLGCILWPFWQFLLLALLLSAIFRPVYNRLQRRLPDWLASLLTCLLITLAVFVPLTLCISVLSAEVIHLYRYSKDVQLLLKIQQIVQNNLLTAHTQAVLKEFGVNFSPSEVTAVLTSLGKFVGLALSNLATAWAANILTIVLQFCMLLMVSFFLLIETRPLVSFLARLSPLPAQQGRLLKEKFMALAGEILIGKGLCGLFQGTIGGLLFAALGVQPALLGGLLLGLLSFLPILGIGLLLLPAAVLLFLYGNFGEAVAVSLYYLVNTLVMKALIEPRFFDNRLRIHNLLILFALLGGMFLFGLLGIIYGPLLVTAVLTLAELSMDDSLAGSTPPAAKPLPGKVRPEGPPG